ncbi:Dihydrodipicolinate synthase/N-acetylneuraminate lyase [Granulicella pectinivorans]|uniref:Dihydrodipicolinate synthase/N-acetylneuraminate lyase n=1 Tax=Granulicella pectinivorans TaxID=474950 RepID=A0A1I6ML14_9BACT|nr:dihydrodipicolinate synthase family protein [Granulicella pectinivorans]SFS16298.1 Dihydrodipicolinate synthase/N-acetylneuraminate lyase [Granulicella pectinivorans]
MLLDGIHVPLTTPFYPDGRLNLRKLEHNVDRYSRTPVAGMIVLGANGEPNTLSDVETREALEAAVAMAADEKVMLAGVARDGVSSALEVAAIAAGLRYDGVVLRLPPTLLGGGVREILTYFQAIADGSALPVLLTSAPGRELTVETIAELAGHPQIMGVVEGSGRIAALKAATSFVKRTATVTTIFAAVTERMLAKAIAPVAGSGSYIALESLGTGTAVAVAPPVAGPGLKTRTRETGFQVLGGSTVEMLTAFRAGALGAVPRMAACAPQACYEVFAGWKDGDEGLAEEKQSRLIQASHRIEGELGVPGLKYACDLNGYFGGRPRLPFVMASGTEKAEIDELMRGMRN